MNRNIKTEKPKEQKYKKNRNPKAESKRFKDFYKSYSGFSLLSFGFFLNDLQSLLIN